MKLNRHWPLAVLALLLMAGVALAQNVQITKGPTVEHTSNNSAVVAWSTNVSSGTVVNYGTDPNNLNQTAQAPWGSLTHRVTIKNLQPGTKYYFRAKSEHGQGSGTGATSEVADFTTQGPQNASNSGSQYDKQFNITNGPNIEQVTGTGATIAWTTDRPASSIVKYGTDPNNLNQTAQEAWGATTHRVHIANLQPGTQYYFSVHSAQGKNAPGQAVNTPPQQFTTAGGNESASNSSGSNSIRITNGPVLERVGDTNATVAWSTNLPSSTVVRYGTNPNNLTQTAQQSWGKKTHRVELNNLQPGTRYYFEVQSAQAQNGGGQTAQAGPMPFTTAPQGQAVGAQQ